MTEILKTLHAEVETAEERLRMAQLAEDKAITASIGASDAKSAQQRIAETGQAVSAARQAHEIAEQTFLRARAEADRQAAAERQEAASVVLAGMPERITDMTAAADGVQKAIEALDRHLRRLDELAAANHAAVVGALRSLNPPGKHDQLRKQLDRLGPLARGNPDATGRLVANGLDSAIKDIPWLRNRIEVHTSSRGLETGVDDRPVSTPIQYAAAHFANAAQAEGLLKDDG